MKETSKQKKVRFKEAEDLRTELKRINEMLDKTKRLEFSMDATAIAAAKKRIEQINRRLTILNVR